MPDKVVNSYQTIKGCLGRGIQNLILPQGSEAQVFIFRQRGFHVQAWLA